VVELLRQKFNTIGLMHSKTQQCTKQRIAAFYLLSFFCIFIWSEMGKNTRVAHITSCGSLKKMLWNTGTWQSF